MAITRSSEMIPHHGDRGDVGVGCGVVQQVTSIFTKFFVVAAYEWLYANKALYQISETSIAGW